MDEEIHSKINASLMFLDEHIDELLVECTNIIKSSSLPWWKKWLRIFRLNRLRKKYGYYSFSIRFSFYLINSLSELPEEDSQQPT